MNTIGATGAAVLWAVGRERSFGVPGAGNLIAHRAILPLNADLLDAETESAAVNQSGFLEPGVPGPRGGTATWSVRLTTGTLLDYLEHLLGGVTKEPLAPGLFHYTFEPTRAGADTSFYALFARSPVLRTWLYGLKLSQLSLSIGDNQEIPVQLEGHITHGTRMSAAEPAPTNAGTYTQGPHLRGALRNPNVGPVHVQVIDTAAGLTFKTEQTATAPTFPGPSVPVVLDTASHATWQNLQGADSQDLGIWEENRDPLEILWPGTATDHQALAPGDTFTFHPPGHWPDPAVPTLEGHQRFTSAHWSIHLRTVGATTWTPLRARKGELTLAWPLTAERGNGSRYPYALLRDGLFTPTLKLERALTDSFFADAAETNTRLEIHLALTGQQLTPTHRESITITFPSCAALKAARSR